MNPQGTSFIPQHPTQGTIKNRTVKKVYLLTYISFVLFFGTILGTAGIFVYKNVQTKLLERQKSQLVIEKDKFSESAIESVRELDKRIESAKKRLENHVSVVSVFKALEESTAQSMLLKTFEYTREEDASPKVVLTAETKIFNSVLFQRDILAKNSVFAKSVFSDIGLEGVASLTDKTPLATDATSTIKLKITSPIDPAVIPFSPTDPMASSSSAEVLSDVTSIGTESSASGGTTSAGQ